MISLFAVNLDDVLQTIRKQPGNIRFAAARSLTSAMQDVKRAEVQKMRSVFDNPTPYTLNSLQVTPATKEGLKAELSFKEFGKTPAWKYLGPQVHGGPRRPKAFERALMRAGILHDGEFCVPTSSVRLDSRGNMSSGQLSQVLSAMGARADPYQSTRKRPKRVTRKRNLDYFVLRGTRAKPGIYQRQERRAVPILLFVRQPTYKARLPYYEKAHEVFRPALRKHFQQNWRKYVVNDKR